MKTLQILSTFTPIILQIVPFAFHFFDWIRWIYQQFVIVIYVTNEIEGMFLKIWILVRNPVSRFWSDLCMQATQDPTTSKEDALKIALEKQKLLFANEKLISMLTNITSQRVKFNSNIKDLDTYLRKLKHLKSKELYKGCYYPYILRIYRLMNKNFIKRGHFRLLQSEDMFSNIELFINDFKTWSINEKEYGKVKQKGKKWISNPLIHQNTFKIGQMDQNDITFLQDVYKGCNKLLYQFVDSHEHLLLPGHEFQKWY